MFLRSSAWCAALALIAAACGTQPASRTSIALPSPLAASASWSDEFDGPAGAFPDSSNWTYDLGNNGNDEQQLYTANRDNVHLDGLGHLVIRVESTAAGYTSARLKTQGLRLAHSGQEIRH